MMDDGCFVGSQIDVIFSNFQNILKMWRQIAISFAFGGGGTLCQAQNILILLNLLTHDKLFLCVPAPPAHRNNNRLSDESDNARSVLIID